MKYMIAGAGAVAVLAGCAGNWEVAYDAPINPAVSRGWVVQDVQVSVPNTLSVSTNPNVLAPADDIVWYGDPDGDRRTQVAAIMDDGITRGTAGLTGGTPVVIGVTLERFHAVTPSATSIAPSAVHQISYTTQVFNADTLTPITPPQQIVADLDAYVGAAAVVNAVEGNTEKVRITQHLEQVTRGWLGVGPDPRREFGGLGR
ncbi:MAG: DUF6778 family protein [Pseudomonadota bacterium]